MGDGTDRVSTLLRNVTGLVAARVITAAAGLVVIAVVFRTLGPGPLGVWVLLTGLTNVVALLDLGLGSTVIRAVAGDVDGGGDRRIRTAMGLGLAWGLVLGLITLSGAALGWPLLASVLQIGDLYQVAGIAVLILLVGLLCDGAAMPWRCLLEGRQRYVTLSSINGSTALAGAVASVLVVWLGAGLIGLAAVTAGTALLRALIIVGLVRRDHVPTLAALTRAELREVAGYGLRVQATSATAVVNLESDRFILAGFFGPAVVAGFELGSRWANLFRLIPNYALVALFPLAVERGAAGGRPWLDQFQLVATRYLTAVAGLGAVALVVSAEPLIRAWLGTPNALAVKAIVILVPAYALTMIAGATCLLARVEGRPGRETAYAVLATGLNLGLTVPLLLWLGPVGVPLGTAAGVLLATGWFLADYQRITGRSLTALLAAGGRPVLAALITWLAVAWLSPLLPDAPGEVGAVVAVITRTGLVIVIMAVLLLATGTVDRAELRRLAVGRRPVEVGA